MTVDNCECMVGVLLWAMIDYDYAAPWLTMVWRDEKKNREGEEKPKRRVRWKIGLCWPHKVALGKKKQINESTPERRPKERRRARKDRFHGIHLDIREWSTDQPLAGLISFLFTHSFSHLPERGRKEGRKEKEGIEREKEGRRETVWARRGRTSVYQSLGKRCLWTMGWRWLLMRRT